MALQTPYSTAAASVELAASPLDGHARPGATAKSPLSPLDAAAVARTCPSAKLDVRFSPPPLDGSAAMTQHKERFFNRVFFCFCFGFSLVV